MVIFFIILISLTPFFKVNAQEYIPYRNNPVIIKDSTLHGYVQPHVLKDSDHFSIWFAENDGLRHKIVRMVSSNGIDWYEKTDTHVSQRNNVHDPFVFLENNEYILFFASSNFGNISLWRSTSKDGITFTTGNEVEILKSALPWEGSHLSCPSVVKIGGIYHLFYSGSGVPNWGIGLATSSDGKSWQRCQNNPIVSPGASAEIIAYDNKFFLYFQSPNGLEVQETDSLNGCSTKWANRHIIKNALRDPSLMVVDNNLWMYGTITNSDGPHIGLAGNKEILTPKYPVIIAPGMFASWNSQAILHNERIESNKWIIQPGVKEYESISGALKNMGYVPNNDMYFFPYDWRQPISQTIKDFDNFLSTNIWNTHPYQPVQLIGHSLGGVILRQYLKENPDRSIKKLITVGSPHYGVIQSYKPVAAGEIDRENTLMWLAQKLILLLNKSKIENDKTTINRFMPILNDLLPIFPYLKNENNEYIQSIHKNHILTAQQLTTSVPQLYLGSFSSQVIAGYHLSFQTPFEKLLNVYEDGHPYTTWKEDGDGVILLKSTLNQRFPVLNLNHGEIIFNKESLKIIFSALGIDVQDNQIPISHETKIFPAIFAFIQSPATMKIEYGDTVENEDQGMIWLQGIQNATYKLNVTGVADGVYTLSIWLVGESGDKWIQYKNNTKNMSVDTYIISFDEKTGGTVNVQQMVTPTQNPTSIPTQDLSGSTSISVSPIQPTMPSKPTLIPNEGVSGTIKRPIRRSQTNKPYIREGEAVVLGTSSTQTKKGVFSKYIVGIIFALTSMILIFINKENVWSFFFRILRRIKFK